MSDQVYMSSSNIFRGGVTAPTQSKEPTTCTATINGGLNPIRIAFTLASKGGGTTQVSLSIGKEDLRQILELLADCDPENAGLFLDCATIANKKSVQLLDKARTDAKQLSLGLGPAVQYVSRHWRDESGQDLDPATAPSLPILELLLSAQAALDNLGFNHRL